MKCIEATAFETVEKKYHKSDNLPSFSREGSGPFCVLFFYVLKIDVEVETMRCGIFLPNLSTENQQLRKQS